MAFNYSFRVAVSLAVALLAGVMWTVDVFWGAFCTALLPIALYWQQKLYRHHVRKVLFMLDAIENNDNAIHFSETENTADARLVNRALNRVAHILYNVKSETAQQEKYYELILDCVNTGILVLNDNGAVYQKNSEALRLLGLNVIGNGRSVVGNFYQYGFRFVAVGTYVDMSFFICIFIRFDGLYGIFQ